MVRISILALLAFARLLVRGLSFGCHRCTGIKLTFVHASIVGAFLEKLSKAVNALPIGLPMGSRREAHSNAGV
jgi:acyl-CoA reductase-like NAD-dependent aldehyde dehydrogenase